MNFERWLISIGKSEKTAHNYSQAVSGSISTWAKEAGLTHAGLEAIQSVGELNTLFPAIEALEIFQERNSKGNGMYSAALKLYTRFLDESTEESVADDIDQILTDKTIPETEKKTFISARVGQGLFRKQLIEQWHGCAVTGYSDTRFLVASHIKPWSKSKGYERLDPSNGLLLLPNLDKVFDLGYISFESSGQIKISQQLEELSMLGINSSMTIRMVDSHQNYMSYHRSTVFKT